MPVVLISPQCTQLLLGHLLGLHWEKPNQICVRCPTPNTPWKSSILDSFIINRKTVHSNCSAVGKNMGNSLGRHLGAEQMQERLPPAAISRGKR